MACPITLGGYKNDGSNNAKSVQQLVNVIFLSTYVRLLVSHDIRPV